MKYRDSIVGNNLHVIKNSFTYVKNSIDVYGLTGTAFGEELSKKAGNTAEVLQRQADRRGGQLGCLNKILDTLTDRLGQMNATINL